MSNALKFTFKGYIELLVEEDVPHDNIIKFTIKDTGIGIPAKVISQLF